MARAWYRHPPRPRAPFLTAVPTNRPTPIASRPNSWSVSLTIAYQAIVPSSAAPTPYSSARPKTGAPARPAASLLRSRQRAPAGAADDVAGNLEVLALDRALADPAALRLARRRQIDLVELHLRAARAVCPVRAHPPECSPITLPASNRPARRSERGWRAGWARNESQSACTSGEPSFLRWVQTPTRNSPRASWASSASRIRTLEASGLSSSTMRGTMPMPQPRLTSARIASLPGSSP